MAPTPTRLLCMPCHLSFPSPLPSSLNFFYLLVLLIVLSLLLHPLHSFLPAPLYFFHFPWLLRSFHSPLTSLHFLHLIIFLSPPFIPPSIKSISAVLVLSYKNHALDEFLCDVLEFSPGFKQRGHLIRTGKPERPELMNHTEQ